MSNKSVGGRSLLAQQMENNGLLFENNSTRLNRMVSSQHERSMHSAKAQKYEHCEQAEQEQAAKTCKDLTNHVKQLLQDDAAENESEQKSQEDLPAFVAATQEPP